MPIIKSKKGKDHSTIKVKVNPEALARMEAYCQWAGIYDYGYFFEKAANELVSQDQEFLLYLKNKEEKLELTQAE